MIARVFGNLLKNAAIYSDEGSVIHISAKRDNDTVIVVFENIGDPISPEELQLLFEKFNRLDQARMSKTGGAGLGLSIAKEIVELHGGTITAQSKDRTVSFSVRLPLVR